MYHVSLHVYAVHRFLNQSNSLSTRRLMLWFIVYSATALLYNVKYIKYKASISNLLVTCNYIATPILYPPSCVASTDWFDDYYIPEVTLFAFCTREKHSLIGIVSSTLSPKSLPLLSVKPLISIWCFFLFIYFKQMYSFVCFRTRSGEQYMFIAVWTGFYEPRSLYLSFFWYRSHSLCIDLYCY